MDIIAFDEILDYNNFSHIPYEEDSGAYFLDIPYTNTITLSFIASLVADLTNNGYITNTEFDDGVAHIKSFLSMESLEELETSAKRICSTSNRKVVLAGQSYYILKKWAKKINRKLEDLQVEVEKMTGDRDYTKRETTYKRGNYGVGGSIWYIINPEINRKDFEYIIKYLRDADIEINPRWFQRRYLHSVADNQFLKDLGYSDNETYVSFMIPRDPINYDFSQNLGDMKGVRRNK